MSSSAAESPEAQAHSGHTGVKVIAKTLATLELIAERGGATAREISAALLIPMPTVYRILGSLVNSGYVVHLHSQRRYELGYRLHQLGVSLHRQVGVPSAVKREIASLHQEVEAAAYFTVYRGPDVIVAYVDDCPKHPRLGSLTFGMHEASHATAFGKIMLSGMDSVERANYLDHHPLTPITPATITDPEQLNDVLCELATTGIAWEYEEFVAGTTCAAVAVRDASGTIIGSVALSSSEPDFRDRSREIEASLRATASSISRWFRTNRTGT